MRRKDKEIEDREAIEELLSTSEVCRLAMVDHGEPYVVPVNYGYRDHALYIHSAPAGRKIDILKKNGRVCFEVESACEITKHAEPCHWGAKARSVIGYGRVEIITDDEEKRRGLDILMAHYGKAEGNVYEDQQVQSVVILKVVIESVTCKQLGG